MPPKSEVPTADEESPVPGFELPAPEPEGAAAESGDSTSLDPIVPDAVPPRPQPEEPAPLPQPLERPRIEKRLRTLLERDQFRADLTREIYHKKLQDIYDKAMGDGDYAGANRAMELLGKSLGFFVEQKAVLNVTSRLQGDKAQEVEEVKRLAKIAGVSFE
jgi:hypothetical protein